MLWLSMSIRYWIIESSVNNKTFSSEIILVHYLPNYNSKRIFVLLERFENILDQELIHRNFLYLCAYNFHEYISKHIHGSRDRKNVYRCLFFNMFQDHQNSVIRYVYPYTHNIWIKRCAKRALACICAIFKFEASFSTVFL